MNAVFKLIQATIPKEYDTLARAIEITNDISRDMDLGEPVVTGDGILKDDKAQCQALLNRITVEIDMKLDMLSYLKGVIGPAAISRTRIITEFLIKRRNIYMRSLRGGVALNR